MMIEADVITEQSSSENPAEPKADVSTVVEAGASENPEIQMESIETSSTQGCLTSSDVILNSRSINGQEKCIAYLETNKGETFEEKLSQSSDYLIGDLDERPEVHFASHHTSFSYEPDEDTISMVSILLQEFTGHILAGLPSLSSRERNVVIEYQDTFSQTFFKALTKVSDRRFVELINMQVNYADPTLIFFCPSYELLSSFKEDTIDRND